MSAALSSPGKVFVLGEYAVLDGRPAVVASVGPRFSMDVREGTAPFHPHPQSPVARLMDWADRAGAYDSSEMKLDFQDPFHGAGGFGASTAQFALAYRVLAAGAGWDT